MKSIDLTIERTGWTMKMVLHHFGLSTSQVDRWKKEKVAGPALLYPFKILDDEIRNVIEYRCSTDDNRSLGYRKFAWKMVDEDIAYLSESSVYRILRNYRLLGPSFKENDGALKEYENKPKYVNHHWHTDLAYVKLSGYHYYLIFMLDGYSRYILDWELMTDMSGKSVDIFVQRVIDAYPDAEPMVIHDNGSQFISRDFKQILFENNCKDVPTRIRHPETNGKAERFVGLIRDEALRPNSPSYYGEAIRVIRKYVDEYNNDRYHSGIGFLKPVDVFEGRKNIILDERKMKLGKARRERFRINSEKNSISRRDLPA